jgi:antirestriction protein ArdC
MKIADLYQSVTADIIKDLEAGTAPWTKPWKNGNTGGILPMNAATKRGYNGINIPILWHAQITHGYRTASWMTYKQASELGAHVRGGQKSTHVVFTKQLNVKDTESDEEKKIGMLKAYSVFNVAQIDGLQLPENMGLLEPEARQDAVTTFIAATKADIRIGGDKACYVPALDFICLPLRALSRAESTSSRPACMNVVTGQEPSHVSIAISKAASMKRLTRPKS